MRKTVYYGPYETCYTLVKRKTGKYSIRWRYGWSNNWHTKSTQYATEIEALNVASQGNYMKARNEL